MVLPSGFVVPPLGALALLGVALGVLAGALARLEPPVTRATALAFVPWMVGGATLRVLERVDGVPPSVAPFATSPAVYGTTAVLAGIIWGVVPRRPILLAGSGTTLSVLGLGWLVVAVPIGRGWPLVAVPIALLLTGLVAIAERKRSSRAWRVAGPLAWVVVGAHALDGVTTAIGVDWLGVREQTPLPRLVMDAAGLLPTADLLGVGWLFVLLKLGLAVGILHLARDELVERPERGRLLLVAVAAVGLGPGIHNLLLFLLG